MDRKNSTFDHLVKSLSKEETQRLLDKINSSMGDVESETVRGVEESSPVNKLKQKNAFGLSEESFFLKLWLAIRSFLRSIPVDVLYNEQLLKRLSSYLRKVSGNYIDVNKKVYTTKFYEQIKLLRKTQVFFSTILTAYDSSKSNFYMLLSSLTTPLIYEKLLKETDPFSVKLGSEVSTKMRTSFLRKIDSIFSNMNDNEKAEMYKSAKALEWMRAFCMLSLDKALLQFSSVGSGDMECAFLTIQPEMEMLSSILTSKKNIPNNLLQAMFLIYSQEKMIEDDARLKAEANEFVKDGIEALQNIKEFLIAVPIVDITRLVKKDINWRPYKIEGGEDWFIYFKQAWYERFNQKWTNWSYEQKKYNLKIQMMNLLKVDDLEPLKFSPWQNLWIECIFKKETDFLFFKTLFYSFYDQVLSPPLKIILMEGHFYKQDNLNEFTTSYNVLQHRKTEFDTFETRLSPVGDIGTAFAKIREEKTATLKNKNKIESLMRSVESEANQIILGSVEALKSIYEILDGILGGTKNANYGSLKNMSSILVSSSIDFKELLGNTREKVHSALDLHSKAEKLETEI